MSRTRIAATAIGLAAALAAPHAQAQSASSSEQEIALLKQQLKMLEQKLDKLQSQTAANTAATAKARLEAKAEARSEAKAVVANANAAIPLKGPAPASGVVVTIAEQPADHLHCRWGKLRRDHRSRALGRRRLRLSAQHGRNRAAETR
ncbi:uncharacterized protein YlxW (UPF0749 family) [Bradyrhizobium sp. GM6.1]